MDRVLLEKITSGDEAAFTELYHTYKVRIYSIALNILQSRTLAEEVLQDTFLALWLKRDSLTAIMNVEAYLTTIARHRTFALFKVIAKDGLAKAEQLEDLLPDNETDAAILGNDYYDIYQKAIQHLSPQQSLVYRLSREEGLKRDEIAQQMALSPETIKSYLAEAVRHVRAYCMAHMELPVWLIVLVCGRR